MLLLKQALILSSLCAVAWCAIPWEAEPKNETWWMQHHQSLLAQTKAHAAQVQVVFLGDSITEGWAGAGKTVWDAHYATRGGYNYGIGGDRTEHLIWRINNGEFDGLHPKFVVLKIGTNNLGTNTAADIAKGVHAVVDALNIKMPNARVLLLSVLPRQPATTDTIVHAINAIISKFGQSNHHINYLDLTAHFESALGQEKEGLFSDTVHLTVKGYEEWYTVMEPTFASLYAPPAIIPWEAAPKNEDWWMFRHQGLLAQTKAHAAQLQVVFLGDSITEGWAGSGKAVWDAHYANRGAYNYGIGGDRTEHLIWRINNGEFEGVHPKFVVLKIGTNNLGHNPAADIAKGVHGVIEALNTKMPNANVLLLSVLPRQPATTDTIVHTINGIIGKFGESNPKITYLDLTTHFELSLGHEKVELFRNDTVHLTDKGYEEWYKAMEPTFVKLYAPTPAA